MGAQGWNFKNSLSYTKGVLFSYVELTFFKGFSRLWVLLGVTRPTGLELGFELDPEQIPDRRVAVVNLKSLLKKALNFPKICKPILFEPLM